MNSISLSSSPFMKLDTLCPRSNSPLFTPPCGVSPPHLPSFTGLWMGFLIPADGPESFPLGMNSSSSSSSSILEGDAPHTGKSIVTALATQMRNLRE